MTNKQKNQDLLKNIPAVNELLQGEQLSEFKEKINHKVLKGIVRQVLNEIRTELSSNSSADYSLDEEYTVSQIKVRINLYLRPSLKKVINATGIPLNTNLSRAPLGKDLIKNILPAIIGYNNLEFNLDTGKRGNRNAHLKDKIKLLFDCEDSLVVNNNAAAVYLALSALCKENEVIVSRGELVEIGGSFRIPDIIKASGALLVEVGTTNKTKLNDYHKAITPATAAILKVHKSNYYIGGFTEEVKLNDLQALAAKNGLLTIYDYGTGLPDRNLLGIDNEETDLSEALSSGADIVTFSCDKLLAGPQAGIIAGKSEYIKELASHPLMRVLRVDKLTIAALDAALNSLFLNREQLLKKVFLYKMLNRSGQDLKRLAEKLSAKLIEIGVANHIVPGKTQCGGGTLPDIYFDSLLVCLDSSGKDKKTDTESAKETAAEQLYKRLLESEIPVVAILREGKLMFDVFALEDDDIDAIVKAMEKIS